MSKSRSSQHDASTSEFKAPDSPAIKVKNRERKKENPDPMYYHPRKHPKLAEFFQWKLDTKLDDDSSLEDKTEKKAAPSQ